MKQQNLFEKEITEFGGSLLEKKRKDRWPLSIKAPILLTIKGDISISGSLLRQSDWIHAEVKKWAAKFEIEIYDYSINSNHMHFCLVASSAENYKNFIRILTGRMAQYLKIKWIQRPHTEIVKRGRHLQNVLFYILKNKEEAAGLRIYCRTKKKKTKTKSLMELPTQQQMESQLQNNFYPIYLISTD